jgi:hypothetical protein
MVDTDMNVMDRKQTDDTLDELITDIYVGSPPFNEARILLECRQMERCMTQIADSQQTFPSHAVQYGNMV